MMTEGQAVEIREVKLDDSISRERPGSAEFTRSTSSSGSNNPQRSSFIVADSVAPMGIQDPNTFFLKKFPFEQLEKEIAALCKENNDSSPVKIWILKQVDHWNNDHEMVIGLTDRHIYLMKYDFVTRKQRGNAQVVLLSSITSITEGNITYPNYSALERRDPLAIRVAWGDVGPLPFSQRWNPFSSNIPYFILANHPFIQAPPESFGDFARHRFEVNNFLQELIQIARQSNLSVLINQEPIVIQCYVGASSLIFNQSQLGFSKDRNGISF